MERFDGSVGDCPFRILCLMSAAATALSAAVVLLLT